MDAKEFSNIFVLKTTIEISIETRIIEKNLKRLLKLEREVLNQCNEAMGEAAT